MNFVNVAGAGDGGTSGSSTAPFWLKPSYRMTGQPTPSEQGGAPPIDRGGDPAEKRDSIQGWLPELAMMWHMGAIQRIYSESGMLRSPAMVNAGWGGIAPTPHGTTLLGAVGPLGLPPAAALEENVAGAFGQRAPAMSWVSGSGHGSGSSSSGQQG